MPLHCSGVGKVLLAHADLEFTEQVLAGCAGTPTARSSTRTFCAASFAECRRTRGAIARVELSEALGRRT
ncbi:MAG TPA: hypothetical protein VIW24_01295 [Aldersonia sp.]